MPSLTCRSLCVVVLGLLAVSGSGPTAAAQRKPSHFEAKKLVEQYFQVEGEERAEIEERLVLLSPLSKREIKTWSQTLAKHARKYGSKVVTKGEAFFYDEATRKGRYFVHSKGTDALLIGMHGGGVGSGDASAALGTFRSAVDKLRWTAIFPEVLEKTEHGWTDSGSEEFVLELIDAALRTFGIDPDRVYLTGHSMGGYGTWVLGAHHADRCAGLAAYAGAPSPIFNRQNEVIDIQRGVLPNLYNIPLWVYQSLDDAQVPPGPNQFAIKKLELLQKEYGGFPFHYDEVTGRGHAGPSEGRVPSLQWISKNVRNLRPRKIVWEPDLEWKTRFYWLRWEKPVRFARVVAEVDGNTIDVHSNDPCQNLKVLIDDELVNLKKEVVVRFNGRETFRGQVEPRLVPLMRCMREAYDPAVRFFAEIPVAP